MSQLGPHELPHEGPESVVPFALRVGDGAPNIEAGVRLLRCHLPGNMLLVAALLLLEFRSQRDPL